MRSERNLPTGGHLIVRQTAPESAEADTKRLPLG